MPASFFERLDKKSADGKKPSADHSVLEEVAQMLLPGGIVNNAPGITAAQKAHMGTAVYGHAKQRLLPEFLVGQIDHLAMGAHSLHGMTQ